MKTLTIDGDTYLVNDSVSDLIIMISKERDLLRDEYMQQARKAGGLDKDALVIPVSAISDEAENNKQEKE